MRTYRQTMVNVIFPSVSISQRSRKCIAASLFFSHSSHTSTTPVLPSLYRPTRLKKEIHLPIMLYPTTSSMPLKDLLKRSLHGLHGEKRGKTALCHVTFPQMVLHSAIRSHQSKQTISVPLPIRHNTRKTKKNGKETASDICTQNFCLYLLRGFQGHRSLQGDRS
ncbi:hypothetical protein BC835DRAFT_561345 [Cytidiella melzeri]|nr:hypothetical protein BC835DRAFT_561345 [Cytidiella melzeri]